MQKPTKDKFLQVGATLILGGMGGTIAHFIGFPAPFLTGSAIAVTFAGLTGLSLSIPILLRNVCFVCIGLSMGSGVTPEVMETIGIWPFAFLILAVSVLGTFLLSRRLLNRYWRFDIHSSTLAASPGHLSFILGLSSQSKADIAAISIVQSIRVMVLTVAVPFAVMAFGMVPEGSAVVRAEMPVLQLGLVIPAAVLIGWLLLKVKVPAAFLLGGMAVSTLTHVTGLVEGQIPLWLAIMAFCIMGSLIGTRFSGVTLAQLKSSATAGLAVVMVASASAIMLATLASYLLDLPLAQLLIAFAPGGLEAMAAMAVIMGVDTTFVAAQHIFRLFLLSFLAPIVLAWEDRKTS